MPKSLYIDPVKVREPGYIHFEDIPVCQYNKTIKQELEEGNYTNCLLYTSDAADE